MNWEEIERLLDILERKHRHPNLKAIFEAAEAELAQYIAPQPDDAEEEEEDA